MGLFTKLNEELNVKSIKDNARTEESIQLIEHELIFGDLSETLSMIEAARAGKILTPKQVKDASVGVYLEDRMAILRTQNSNVRFHVEYNLGHWIMYEDEKIFNKILQNIIQD